MHIIALPGVFFGSHICVAFKRNNKMAVIGKTARFRCFGDAIAFFQHDLGEVKLHKRRVFFNTHSRDGFEIGCELGSADEKPFGQLLKFGVKLKVFGYILHNIVYVHYLKWRVYRFGTGHALYQRVGYRREYQNAPFMFAPFVCVDDLFAASYQKIRRFLGQRYHRHAKSLKAAYFDVLEKVTKQAFPKVYHIPFIYAGVVVCGLGAVQGIRAVYNRTRRGRFYNLLAVFD